MGYNSKLYLLKGIELRSNNRDTYTFPNPTEQFSFFTAPSKVVKIVESASFTRLDKSITVKKKFDEVVEATYLVFTNTTSGKTYYAFIDTVEYGNELNTKINYTIDPLQTYYFNWNLKENFIERQHVLVDTAGLHLQNENLDVGNIVIPHFRDIPFTQQLIIVVGATVELSNPAFPDIQGRILGGMYAGIALFGFTNDAIGAGQINQLLTDLATDGKTDAVKFIYMQPKIITQGVFVSGDELTGVKTVSEFVNKNQLPDFGGYVPKNKKMFTYPYNFFSVLGGTIKESDYKYEFFKGNIATACELVIYGSIGVNPVLAIAPKEYKEIVIKWNEALAIDNFPMCSYVTDYYTNWLAQNQVSNAVGVAGSLLSLGVGIATVNPIAIAGGVLGVASTIGGFVQNSLKPNQVNGSVSASASISANLNGMQIAFKQVTTENAKLIDAYFSKYGYKVNVLETPQLVTRKAYNYIKTVGMNVLGNIPQKYVKVINSLFDEGITFWHTDNLGDYSQDNGVPV
jgi:hypothetical protein